MTTKSNDRGFVLLLHETFTSPDGKHQMYRVQATRDRLGGAVKAGEKGGWLSFPDNLSDDAWVADDAQVLSYGARVSGTALVCGKSTLWTNAKVGDSARVVDTRMSGSSYVGGHAVVRHSKLFDDAVVNGHSTVYEGEIKTGSVVTDNADVSYSSLVRGVLVGGQMEIYKCFLSGANKYNGQYRMDKVIHQ